ncbi:Hypothetical predicted protein [Paramuricea clavata]|uniref:Uncharacterized protein n=2 Tax=Paramuricea clavata TaxID=317549 RepID=A0A7D9I3C3_PARCT|nr:Hypothetical predicted protein [Paramuricea clavata]
MVPASHTIMELEEPNSNVPQKPKGKAVTIACLQVNLTIANVFFAFLSIAGQVGMKVTLPLWIDSTILTPSGRHSSYDIQANATGNLSNPTNSSTGDIGMYKPEVDAYFVLSFGIIACFTIFGAGLLFIRLFQPHQLGETERTFPHLQFFLAGFFNALNGVFIVFASSGRRTAPYLQAILSNVMIPLIIALR